MNWKLIVFGGVAFYVVAFLLSMASGPLIHTGVLDKPYNETAEFWRPELREDPPDMAALMPRWIATGLITSMLFAAAYCTVRSALGRGWSAGLKFGVMLWVIASCLIAGYSGVFDLPAKIWIWWSVETAVMYPLGGAAMGWVGERLAPG